MPASTIYTGGPNATPGINEGGGAVGYQASYTYPPLLISSYPCRTIFTAADDGMWVVFQSLNILGAIPYLRPLTSGVVSSLQYLYVPNDHSADGSWGNHVIESDLYVSDWPIYGSAYFNVYYAGAITSTLTISANIIGSGTVSGTGIQPNPSFQISLVATPTAPQTFVAWKDEGGAVLSTDVCLVLPAQTTNRTITAQFTLPPTAKLNGQFTYTSTACLGGDGAGRVALTKGGQVAYTRAINPNYGLFLAADGSTSGTSDDIDVGDPINIWATVNDLRSRVVSMIVDGVETVTGLGPYGTQTYFGIMPAHDVAFTVVMQGDAPCVVGGIFPLPTTTTNPPGLPPSGSGPGDGGGTDGPAGEPPPIVDPIDPEEYPEPTQPDPDPTPDPTPIPDPTTDDPPATVSLFFNGDCVFSGTPIKVLFSQNMDASTINASTFLVTGSTGQILGVVAYDATTRIASLEPFVVLPENTTYELILTNAISNVVGVHIAETRLSFVTCVTYNPIWNFYDPITYGRKPFTDRLGFGMPRGLIVRWRDNGKKTWGKDHVIDLGVAGDSNIVKSLGGGMGEYRTRQYELLLIDRVPTAVFGIEERIKASSDIKGNKK